MGQAWRPRTSRSCFSRSSRRSRWAKAPASASRSATGSSTRTAFYPSSGGQPFDTGTIGPLRVVDVVDEEDGSIAHVVEPGPVVERVSATAPRDTAAPADQAEPVRQLEPRQVVHGVIDWARR